MKNLKTTLKTKKDHSETVFLYPTLKDAYFSPSSSQLYRIPIEFDEFCEKVEQMSYHHIDFIPVTVEDSEDVKNRNQYRGYSSYHLNEQLERVNYTVDPIVIRGNPLPEFALTVHQNKSVGISHSYMSRQELTAGQRNLILEQLPEQILRYDIDAILEELKSEALVKAEDRIREYILEVEDDLDNIRNLIK